MYEIDPQHTVAIANALRLFQDGHNIKNAAASAGITTAVLEETLREILEESVHSQLTPAQKLLRSPQLCEIIHSRFSFEITLSIDQITEPPTIILEGPCCHEEEMRLMEQRIRDIDPDALLHFDITIKE